MTYTTCPKCKREVVVTCSLRPENWPAQLLYHVCNFCSWEEKDVALKDAKYIRTQLNKLKMDKPFREN